jgi:hypothetical protein
MSGPALLHPSKNACKLALTSIIMFVVLADMVVGTR